MSSLQSILQNGAEGYTPATMWFTNGNVNKQEMTYQIEGFCKQGIKDYFIHPSDGTWGDYLGEHFFRMIRHAVEEAKRLDMRFWIYDEYNWPSGVAGGKVLADEPWTHASRLFRLKQQVKGGETITFALPSRERYHTEALLFSVDGQEVAVGLEGDLVTWKNESDEDKTLEVFITKWIMGKNSAISRSDVVEHDVEGCLDTLDQEAVRVFIEKTHEVYKEQVGDAFGTYVKGVFTDETVLLYDLREPEEEGLEVRPWTRQFLAKFQERNGYDIRPRLKELMDTSDVKVCVDYWDTIAELFINAFPKMVYDWCTENNLIFTGHIDAEESVEAAVYRNGDPYEYYRYFTWPGIDNIYSYYRKDDYSFPMAAKLASSAAHFHGKERVLSETYTVSGWDIRLQDMKRIFNKLALLGVNCLQFMGSRYSFKPGADNTSMTNNWQNPLFRHYHAFSKYVSGIQWLVANTEYDAHTLLFYPLTTVRATFPPLPTEVYETELDHTVVGVINSLMHLEIPFEFGFEQVIEEAEVRDGCFHFAGETYHTLILPCTTHLRERTFAKVQEFLACGGRVIAINGKPEKIVGDTIYDAPALEGAVVYDCFEYELMGENVTMLDSYQRAPMGRFTACLQDALKGMPKETVELEPCEGLFSAIRKKGDAVYALISNDTDAVLTAKGAVNANLPYRAYTAENGEELAIERNGQAFTICLKPYELVILEVSAEIEGCGTCLAEERKRREGREICPKKIEFKPCGPNAALPTLYQVRGTAAEALREANRAYNPKKVCDLAKGLSDEDLAICKGGVPGSMPVKAARDWYGWQPADGKPFEPGETVVSVYDFTLDEIPAVLEMISDPEIDTTWYLNEEMLFASSVRRVWHYANPVFDLKDLVVPGDNRLVAFSRMPSYPCPSYCLPCALLVGDFRVFEDHVLTGKPGANRVGYWNDMGYYFYTGDGVYTVEFEAPESGNVGLELKTRDVTEVWVNGSYVGKRLWEPYTFELTEYLRAGENQLEVKVTSTMSNFIYKRNPSGLEGLRLYELL